MMVIVIKRLRRQKCVIKRRIKFNDCKDCLLNNEIILKWSEAHNVYIEEINKIALSSNDGKRLQIFHRIASYPYDESVGKVCKTVLLSKYNKYKWLILMIIQRKIKQK